MFFVFHSYFKNPKPPLEVVQSSVDKLRMATLEVLKHKSVQKRISLEFRHDDVYKYLFDGLGQPAEQRKWTLFEEKDLLRCKLPEIGVAYMIVMEME